MTPTIPLTAAQQIADADALSKISSAYNLVITGGVTAVVAATAASAVSVSDTAANVLTYLSQLQTQATAGRITSIALTDSTTPTLVLTAAQYTADTTVLGKISSAYNLAISGVSVSNASSIASAAHVTSVAVSDTAANMLAGIAALQTLASGGKLSAITLTDVATPTISLTEAQMVADASVLSKIVSAYNLTLTGGGTSTMPTGVAPQSITLQSAASVYNVTANSTSHLAIVDTGANGNDTINASAGDTVTIGGNDQYGNGDNINMSNGTVVLQNSARADVYGGGNTITTGINDLLGVQNGNNNTITADTGTVIYINSGTGDVVNTINGGVDVITDVGVTVSIVGGNNSVEAANGDTVNISGNGQFGNDDFVTITSGTVNVAANARADVYGASNTVTAGANTLIGIQSGNSNTVNLGANSVVYVNDGANDIINGGGSEQYNFTSTFGSTTINNGGGSSANSSVVFAAGLTNQNLWLTQSANNLVIRKLGTSNIITVTGWFNGTLGNELQLIQTNDGLNLSPAAVTQIVNAMAAYQSAHSTFNAATATAMPTDTTLQTAISNSWHGIISSSGVTVAYATANQAAVDAIAGGYTIADTVANVLAGMTFLNSDVAHIAAIQLTDGTTPTLALTATQYTADTTVLGKITSAYNVTVSGVTAANASTVAGNTHVTSLTVSDTAANFVTNIAALQTLAGGTKLSSITLTDGTTPTLALTGAQYAADTAALGKISSAYNLTVSVVTAANASSVAGNTHVTSLTVADTGANFVSNIAALQTLAGGTKLSSITLTDGTTPTLALTAAQYAADTAALNKISSAYNVSVSGVTAGNASSVASQSHFVSETISDTAANFVSNISALETLASTGKVTSIAFTDGTTPTITLTPAQQTADADALNKITSAYNLVINNGAVTAAVAATATSPVAVSDTAANVLTYLSQLQTQAVAGRITSIALTDGTTPTLALTATQYAADTAVLGKISSAYNLSISGVTAADSINTGNAAHVASLTVADTATNFYFYVTTLSDLATAGKLTSITLTDSTTPTIVAYKSVWDSRRSAFDKIISAYNLNIYNVLVADASTVAATAHVTGVDIVDTAVNVTAGMTALQTLASNGKLVQIEFTDSTTPTIALTATQYAADTTVLSKIITAYNVTVSAVTATNASSVAGNTHVTSLTVSDIGANFVANIAALQTLATGTKLASITLTDGTTPTLALALTQYNADTAALGKIGSAYNLSISGVAAANASSTAALAHVTSVSVSDTAANFVTNIAALQTLASGGKLSAVTLTDGTTPTISLTEAQMLADTSALSKIASAYNLTLTGGGTATMPTGVAPQKITLQSAASVYTLTANSTSNLAIVDTGTSGGDTINASAGDTVTIGGNGQFGNGDNVTMSNGTVALQNSARADVYGGGNTIATGTNDLLGVQNGNNNTITAGTGTTVYLNSGTGHVVNATAGSVDVEAATGVTMSIVGGNNTVNAAIGDTISVSGNGQYGSGDYISVSSGTVNMAANSHADIYGASNTITAGANTLIGIQNGNGNVATVGANSEIYVNDTSNTTINGGGTEIYHFASAFGLDVINNGSGSTANGKISFDGTETNQKLWFIKSGNDLLIDLLGTNDQVKVAGWYVSAGKQVASITAGGKILDTQVAQLVNAMATYQTGHSSFNPTATSTMPTDTTLQNAITAAWHV